MSLLKSLSIGAKLLMLPALFVLALLVVSGMAYYGLARQQAVIEEIDQLRFQQYRQVLETSSASQAAMVGAYATGSRILESSGQASAEELESYLEDMQASVDDMRAGLDKVARETRLGEEEKELYRAVQDQAAVVGEGLEEFKRTALSDQVQAASLLGRVRADNNGLQGQFNRLLGLQAELTSAAFAEAGAMQRQVSRMLVTVLLIASALAVLASLLLRAQIIRPIREIEQASIEMRDGDLTRRVRVMGRDEVAHTAQAFNQLIDSFQQAMRQVAAVAASVGASAEELVGTSARVAESSTAQAGAVGAVSMTIEQMSDGIAAISSHAESLRSCAEASLRGPKTGTWRCRGCSRKSTACALPSRPSAVRWATSSKAPRQSPPASVRSRTSRRRPACSRSTRRSRRPGPARADAVSAWWLTKCATWRSARRWPPTRSIS